jgi:hypothetical protein
MPWINDKIYIETDLRHLTDSELQMRVFGILRRYEEQHQPIMPDIQPPYEEVKAVYDVYNKRYFIKTHFGQGGEKGKEKLSLRKELLRLMDLWGAYYIEQVKAGRLHYFLTGFEYFSMDSARRPGPTTTFYAGPDHKKGLFRMECQKKPAILTWFHWEVSEDGGNTWITLGKTRNPHFTTKKLDLKKPYRFRMYASNPKGNSEVAYREYRGWG